MRRALLTLVWVGFLLAVPKTVLAASLSLSPSSGSHVVGTTFTVDIILDPTSESVSAASAIVNFDTTKLTVISVTQGALFNQAPLTNTIDTTAGQIRYDSGSLGTAITTSGTMATITFRGIAAGSATTTILFDPTATTGTSLVAAASGPTNLLTRVDGGIYTITAATTTTTTTTTPTTSYYLPPTGAVENTIAIFVGGLMFLGTGVFLARRYFYAR